MKALILFLLFIASFQTIYSQNIGNEWIQYDQLYYKMKISKSGIYKLTYNDLLNAGFPLNSIDARNIQIFARGKEIPIFIEGENDGIFNTSDFILFHGEKNDGWLDSILFKENEVQANPYYSLYNDTASFFITANKSITNKRYIKNNEYTGAATSSYDYCLAEPRIIYLSKYYQGAQDPLFTSGEGWASDILAAGKTFTASLNTPHFKQINNVSSTAKIGMVGVSRTIHNLEIQFTETSQKLQFSGLYSKHLVYTSANILQNKTNVSILNKSTSTDNNAICYISILYPHTFDFSDYTTFNFTLPPSQIEASVDITVPAENSYLFLKESQKIWQNANADNVLRINTTSTEKNGGIFVRESALQSVTNILPVEGNGYFTDFMTLEKQGDFLIFTHTDLLNATENYVSYKASQGYMPTAINVEKLYDQFAYGIAKHPLALRNFCSMALKKWQTKPSYLFIMGKGVHATSFRKNADLFKMCKIPSMGIPSSDNMITEGLTSKDFVPSIATGRLSATNEYHIAIYLDKVESFDKAIPDQWMKNILHFGGGKDETEQEIFKNYLAEYETILRNSKFAGDVSTVLKNSSEAIEISKLDMVKKKINEGTAIMNFFGHSASTGFDQDIDNPEAYRNEGKYPFLIASSCYSGDIFTTSTNSISERWVLIEKRGVMAFIASVNLGYATYLHTFHKNLITHFAETDYGKSLGYCFVQTADSLMEIAPNNELLASTCLDITIHGDPSLAIYPHVLPDYTINNGDISFTPHIITTAADSFAVDAIITNAGRNWNDTICLEALLISPEKDTLTKLRHIVPSGFQDTVRFYFYHNGLSSMGENTVLIHVDSENTVEEYNEENNTASANFPIYANAVVPVMPRKYAIIPNSTTTLVASFAGIDEKNKNCIFQVDTTPNFNSSFIKEYTVAMESKTIEFQLPIDLQNNVVYYWRVRSEDDQQWLESTFTYKEGLTGWSQSSSKHFSENEFEQILYNSKGNTEFIQSIKKLYCSTKGSASNDSDYEKVKLTLDGGLQAWGCCGPAPAINVSVIDSLELQSWLSDIANFNHRNYPTCSGRVSKQFYFSSQDPIQLQGMARLLDSVEKGNYIVIQTFRYGYFDSWDNTIFEACENAGANIIRSVPNNYPYIFFGKKGYPETVIEVMGETPSDLIEMYADIHGQFSSGSMLSPIIGPAIVWGSIESNVKNNIENDFYINVWGITAEGEQALLLENITTNNFSIKDTIPAQKYPYLQLEFYTENTETRIPAEVLNWDVIYTPTAEIAVDNSLNFFFYNDTIDEGENIELIITARNIGTIQADSIIVKKGIRNANNANVIVKTDTLYAIAGKSNITDTTVFPSIGLEGTNNIFVEFNALSDNGSRFLHESNYFNNSFSKQFYVKTDVANPVMEILFNNHFINNGDYVSSQPNIDIHIFDNNDYFPINDTALFNVYIGNSKTLDEIRIPFSGSEYKTNVSLNFIEYNNSAILSLHPSFDNGSYYISVKASDTKGNAIANDYTIEFTVDSIPTVSDILYGFDKEYGKSFFYFTITGNEIPQSLIINILSVDGRIVNQLDFSDHLKLGDNKITVDWDGTSVTGKPMLNGIYYYYPSFDTSFSLDHQSQNTWIVNGYGILHLFR